MRISFRKEQVLTWVGRTLLNMKYVKRVSESRPPCCQKLGHAFIHKYLLALGLLRVEE